MPNTVRTGTLSELKAMAWLVEQGYEVFRNISAEGPFDLIAIRPGETIYIDVKTLAPRMYQGEKVLQRGKFSKTADKYPDLNKKLLYVYKDQVDWKVLAFEP